MRPTAASSASSKLCTPIDSRFTPGAGEVAKPADLEGAGFASIVTSASGASRSRARTISSSASIERGENRLGVPPPMNTVCTLRPHTSGSEASRSACSAAR